MYFFLKGGKQYVDLRGDFIISHNDALVKTRVKSAAPTAVANGYYAINVHALSFWKKLSLAIAVAGFIFGKNEALKDHDV